MRKAVNKNGSFYIGKTGENDTMQVPFPVGRWLNEYPDCTIHLAYKRPDRADFYDVQNLEIVNGELLWTVADVDVEVAGEGLAELQMLRGEQVEKSKTYIINITKSAVMGEEPSDPVKDYFLRVVELEQDAIEAKETVTTMSAEAETLESGSEATAEYDHENNVMLFGIPSGEKGDDGEDGQDGFSPVVTVDEITGGHEISITDAEGTNTFDVMDGVNGQDGSDGQDGADGFSPSVTIESIMGGHEITITDKEHPTGQTFNVMDGEDAEAIIDDVTPAVDKVYSSSKVSGELMSLNQAIDGLSDDVHSVEGYLYKQKTNTFRKSENVQSGASFLARNAFVDVDIPSGKTYTVKLTSGNDLVEGGFAVYEMNSSGTTNRLTSHYSVPLTVEASFDVKHISIYGTTESAGTVSIEVEYIENFDNSITEKVEQLEEIKDLFQVSNNLFDKDRITVGYMTKSGSTGGNTSYVYTDYIPVSAGEKLIAGVNRYKYVTAFDADKVVLSDLGSDTAINPAIFSVQEGVSYLRVTIDALDSYDNVMMNTGNSLLPFEPFGNVTIKESAIKSVDADKITGVNLNQFGTILGNNSIRLKENATVSNETVSLLSAPFYIKKNVCVSYSGKFDDDFAGLEVGKGYQVYRGKWIDIDDTSIKIYNCPSNGTKVLLDTISHGLTISDFINVNMYMDGDGECHIAINTISGTFMTDYDFGHEWNYQPFATAKQAMTDVSLNYSADDLRKPLWMFGDSYFGIATNRVIGQLRNLGFYDGFLVDAIAGMRAIDTGEINKSAKDELERMLAFSTPKYIVWAEGMNGNESNSISAIQWLMSVCAEKDISLILYKTPNVPDISHDTLNTFVEETGVRFVDGYAAVGSSSDGTWYDGYLDTSDNVHPTELGAKALAMQFIVDVPELTQYGYSVGSSGGDISGDEH